MYSEFHSMNKPIANINLSLNKTFSVHFQSDFRFRFQRHPIFRCDERSDLSCALFCDKWANFTNPFVFWAFLRALFAAVCSLYRFALSAFFAAFAAALFSVSFVFCSFSLPVSFSLFCLLGLFFGWSPPGASGGLAIAQNNYISQTEIHCRIVDLKFLVLPNLQNLLKNKKNVTKTQTKPTENKDNCCCNL